MILNCPSCQRPNRVPVERLTEAGSCGACKAELPPVGVPLEVDPAAFDEVVAGTPVPVLVDFWAGWCMPCRRAAPEVERTAKEMAGRAVVLKVDTQSHPELADRFDVRGIPNFVVLRGGQVASRHVGATDHREMVRWLSEAGLGS